MAYEPRPVPPYPEIQPNWWYCLECVRAGATHAEVMNHWIVAHGGQGEKPTEGLDIARGSELATMTARRNAYIETVAQRFADEMYAGFTGEDFVAESEIRSA